MKSHFLRHHDSALALPAIAIELDPFRLDHGGESGQEQPDHTVNEDKDELADTDDDQVDGVV